MKEEYEIEYSRFFNYPIKPLSLSTTPPLLRPLSQSQKFLHGGGIWLSSSSAASLRLLTDLSTSERILVVSLRQKIHEEHFISKLHFSWPQMACDSQSPVRGSRVIFVSYKDCAGQIQKFAIRFSNSSESLAFINSLKESLKDVRNIDQPSCNTRSEISPPPSEMIISNGINNSYRADEELTHMDPVENFNMLPSSPDYYEVQYSCSQETTLPHDTRGTYGILPSSFTELLADSCTEAEAAEQEQPTIPEGVDLKTLTARYMTGSSFHDMLGKLEKVISDMGGDLTLQFS